MDLEELGGPPGLEAEEGGVAGKPHRHLHQEGLGLSRPLQGPLQAPSGGLRQGPRGRREREYCLNPCRVGTLPAEAWGLVR